MCPLGSKARESARPGMRGFSGLPYRISKRPTVLQRTAGFVSWAAVHVLQQLLPPPPPPARSMAHRFGLDSGQDPLQALKSASQRLEARTKTAQQDVVSKAFGWFSATVDKARGAPYLHTHTRAAAPSHWRRRAAAARAGGRN